MTKSLEDIYIEMKCSKKEEKTECPKCDGEGCDHCGDTGYHEELTPKQKKLDIDKDGEIGSGDLKKVRAGKVSEKAIKEKIKEAAGASLQKQIADRKRAGAKMVQAVADAKRPIRATHPVEIGDVDAKPMSDGQHVADSVKAKAGKRSNDREQGDSLQKMTQKEQVELDETWSPPETAIDNTYAKNVIAPAQTKLRAKLRNLMRQVSATSSYSAIALAIKSVLDDDEIDEDRKVFWMGETLGNRNKMAKFEKMADDLIKKGVKIGHEKDNKIIKLKEEVELSEKEEKLKKDHQWISYVTRGGDKGRVQVHKTQAFKALTHYRKNMKSAQLEAVELDEKEEKLKKDHQWISYVTRGGDKGRVQVHKTQAFKALTHYRKNMKSAQLEEVEKSASKEKDENAFMAKAAFSAAAGKKKMKMGDKEYPVTMSKANASKVKKAVSEGAVASATVRKEIAKAGGKNVRQDQKSITFEMDGQKRSVPLYKNFVADKDYMKLRDEL